MKTNIDAMLTAKKRCNTFAQIEGRRPRILLTNIHQDASDRDVNFKASALANTGFDVDLSPTSTSAKVISKQAIENDNHAIYIISHTNLTLDLLIQIMDCLAIYNRKDILLVVDNDHKTHYNLLSTYKSFYALDSKTGFYDTIVQILNILLQRTS
ncbi:hypothetical protein FNB79_16705 [Formosa sediminum]|uniref:B12-binding domain-containing protein n=1 Tax=Formosa sediminum TaxID=2594004 RepID=A0A516GVY6_9FLAO|nr:hypothetical protein [Formosa sediminum]QDO95540.1 hypothetical protein FNB79_16705 [Formosa sediminum]